MIALAPVVVDETDKSIIDYFLKKQCRVKNPFVRDKLTASLVERWGPEARMFDNNLEAYLYRFVNIANSF